MSPACSDIDKTRLDRFLGFRLFRAKIQIHKMFLNRLAALGLSPGEFSVLVIIDANPGVAQRQLGAALEISPPNLVPLIERLAQREALVRSPSQKDRRVQELHLTQAGLRLLRQAEAKVEPFERMLEQALSATELRYVSSALKKLTALQAPK